MNIAIDIDDTITALPRLFAAVTRAREVNRVIIVSSRSNRPEVRKLTEQELAGLGVRYDKLFLLDSYEEAKANCPHDNLDWHQKYLWQKVDICLNERIDIVFEDDVKVLSLFQRFAPSIQLVQIHSCQEKGTGLISP